MSVSYKMTIGGFTFTTPVPDNQLVDPTVAAQLAAQLGGSITLLFPKGSVPEPSEGEMRNWFGIIVDPNRFPGVPVNQDGSEVPIPAYGLVNMQLNGGYPATPGVWKADMNGQPAWVPTPAPPSAAPPASNPPNTFPGFPGSHPSGAITLSDLWNALIAIKSEVDAIKTKVSA